MAVLSRAAVTIDRAKLTARLAAEEQRFITTHPRSLALFEEAKGHLLGGVPMNWMLRWAGRFPVFVREGSGARFSDVDGHEYLDLCLGDTGGMTGHTPPAVIEAVTDRVRRGVTFMLPTEDAVWVGAELARRFGLRSWQFVLSATDANRFALRLARQVTGRRLIAVFNGCYHGTVDETFAVLDGGITVSRPGNIGPAVDPATTTRVIEFNDIAALESALAPGDVACVLAEPVMTNIGIIHPEPGFHEALRDITRRTGTLLVLDETHTICTGPGGYTAANGLTPDMLTLGKPIAGGIPGAAYGLSDEVAERVNRMAHRDLADTGGIGGTLAGNALSLAAMRATLGDVLTPAAYAKSIALAERFTRGVEGVITEKGLPWIVNQLGCRAEYWFRASAPRNGSEAMAAIDGELDRYMHLAALNRGILLTPFHNMALIAPAVQPWDIDYHTQVFRQCVDPILR
ncbi:MAG: aspartate aminotransferase family protein [Gemmatimonadota bacterium]